MTNVAEREYREQKYHFNTRDWMEFGVRILVKGGMISYLFYDSLKAMVLFIPFGVVEYQSMKKIKREQAKRELTLQFKSLIESLETSLSAGYSMERAFVESKRDLELIYDKKAGIFRELQIILTGVSMNVPIEQLLKNFGLRSGIDDISNFANVVLAAKRSGGNLIHIIRKTVNSISDKLEVEEEINTMIAAKKLEQRIMMLMPYGIILYMRMTNGGFFDVLYHNLVGIALMTVFLMVIYMADYWAQRIMEIRV